LGIPQEKLTITGNLKFDIPVPNPRDHLSLREELKLSEDDLVITLGSTHEGEEELLLNTIMPLQKNLSPPQNTSSAPTPRAVPQNQTTPHSLP